MPVDIDDIGMDPIPGLPQVIEDILIGALVPRLPEVRIREIVLPNKPHKVVYLVWHPESWESPHMIHTYDDHRYYRRGNYRAVKMEEAEVERLYLRRQSYRTTSTRFFERADFGGSLLPNDGPYMRLVLCPAFPFDDRVDFTSKIMRQWLDAHFPYTRNRWVPFISGVRSSYASHDSLEREGANFTEVRWFRNGAISFCEYGKGLLRVQRFMTKLDLALGDCRQIYECVGMAGKVLIDIGFFNVKGLRLEPGVSLFHYNLDDVDFLWHKDILQFQLVSDAVELLTENGRRVLEGRIVNRLAQCFGMWSMPGYSEQDGSLTRR